jgi:16S rRNA pseudouridine516 synthase
MRVDKFLANSGYGTRKDIKNYIKQGIITVNGAIVKDGGMHVDENKDEICINGESAKYKKYIYIMLSKPQGVVSATYDKHLPTVVDLLDEYSLSFEPFPVGRLDIDTEGLLVLTNDGDMSHRLLSPKSHVKKIYYAKLDKPIDNSDIRAFAEGVTLDDGYKTLGADLEAADDGAIITIYEGKFHQVKRMFEAVGKKVTYLKRLQMGNLKLDKTLNSGQWRELTEKEIDLLCEKQETE